MITEAPSCSFFALVFCRYYGTKCTGCLLPIPPNELVMRAVGLVYHLRCFMCAACGHQLQKGDQFVVKDGQLFCRLDFEKEYALMISPKNDWCSAFSPKCKKIATLCVGYPLVAPCFAVQVKLVHRLDLYFRRTKSCADFLTRWKICLWIPFRAIDTPEILPNLSLDIWQRSQA